MRLVKPIALLLCLVLAALLLVGGAHALLDNYNEATAADRLERAIQEFDSEEAFREHVASIRKDLQNVHNGDLIEWGSFGQIHMLKTYREPRYILISMDGEFAFGSAAITVDDDYDVSRVKRVIPRGSPEWHELMVDFAHREHECLAGSHD